MITLDIRPFRDADEADVAALWEEVFADDPSWNSAREVIRRKQATQPELFLIGRSGPLLVGAVLAGYDGVRGWIYHLAVLPQARRKGIASRLVKEAERLLADLGCPKVNLQVRSGNESAVALYRRLGYETESRVSMGKLLGARTH